MSNASNETHSLQTRPNQTNIKNLSYSRDMVSCVGALFAIAIIAIIGFKWLYFSR